MNKAEQEEIPQSNTYLKLPAISEAMEGTKSIAVGFV